jgi:hypothetical protein
MLVAAAAGAVLRASGGSPLGRAGGIFAAVLLAAVAAGVWSRRRWALGAAFFLGVFWLWAVLALRMQGVMGGGEVALWLGWSAVVITGTLKAREA